MSHTVNQLQKRAIVRCPLSQAPGYLDRFFAECADANGQIRLTLRAPLQVPRMSVELALERSVRICVERGPALGKGRPLYVRWSADAGGPFPTFVGTLEVEADEDYASSRLALAGTYEPPLGLAGKVFDAVLGHHIALATARDLLGRIAEYIEHSYADTEAHKAVLRGSIA